MSLRLALISITVLLVPVSAFVLFLWLIYASSVLFAGDVRHSLSLLWQAVSVQPNPPLALYIARQFIGAIGGLVGWPALIALLLYQDRPWRAIPIWVKTGCGIGVVAALVLPAAPGVALPPVLLAAALVILAKGRAA